MTDNDIEPSPTSHRLQRALHRGVVGFWLLVRETLRHLGPVLAAVWRAARPILRGVLQMLLALIIVFEEWVWQPLADLLAAREVAPWAAVKTAIARRPPTPPGRIRAAVGAAAAAEIPGGVPGRTGTDRDGGPTVSGRQGGGHRAHRAPVPSHPALADADRLVRARLRYRHAVEGRPGRTRARVLGVAGGAHLKERSRCVIMRQWWQMRPTMRSRGAFRRLRASRARRHTSPAPRGNASARYSHDSLNFRNKPANTHTL